MEVGSHGSRGKDEQPVFSTVTGGPAHVVASPDQMRLIRGAPAHSYTPLACVVMMESRTVNAKGPHCSLSKKNIVFWGYFRLLSTFAWYCRSDCFLR